MFCVDRQIVEVRREIFRIHAARRNLDTASLNLNQLMLLTDGFSGSEIEQMVVYAIYSAHAADDPISTELLEHEISHTRPLWILMEEKIEALRQWSQRRAASVD